MKLHQPDYPMASCGITAVAILTGESLNKVRGRVLAIREKFPRDYNGNHCPKSKMMHNTDYTYISELKRALLDKKIKLKKFKPFRGKIKSFALKHPKGHFFLNFSNHVAIYKDGKVYDNSFYFESLPSYYLFRNDVILSFAEIIRAN